MVNWAVREKLARSKKARSNVFLMAGNIRIFGRF